LALETINYLNNYKYSTYLDYMGEYRIQNKILNKKAFPNYFPKQKDFSAEILEWITYKND